MPLLVAPVAFQRLVDPDGEVAMARAAAAAGTIMCLSTIATSRPSEIAAEAPPGAALVSALLLPRPRGHPGADRRGGRVGLRRDRADRRRAARRPARARLSHRLRGPGADQRPGGRRGDRLGARDHRPGGVRARRPVARLGRLRRARRRLLAAGAAQGRADGARTRRLAVEHGAAGVIVSNHGGRQLDGVAGDARAAARGGRGGRRALRGADRRRDPPRHRRGDRARARRAGGARRPGAALGPGGRRRARRRCACSRSCASEIELALTLLGCPSPAEVTPEHVRSAPRLAQ